MGGVGPSKYTSVYRLGEKLRSLRARPRPSRSFRRAFVLRFFPCSSSWPGRKKRGTLAVDGSGVGVPGGAGRDPAGARGMVRGARRPVPAKAMAPAHPQAGAVPRPRRRPGPHDSIINDVSFRLPTLVGCILAYSVRLDQFRATWLLFTCDR
jgi:hypothetical protein